MRFPVCRHETVAVIRREDAVGRCLRCQVTLNLKTLPPIEPPRTIWKPKGKPRDA